MWNRREILERMGGGIGALALTYLLAQEHRPVYAAPGTPSLPAEGEPPVPKPLQGPLAPRKPHFEPKVKNVISIFLPGGLSHVDSFDPKPELARRNGAKLRASDERTLYQSPWGSARYGKSGMELTSLFPAIASQADRLAVIRSVVTRNGNHTPAMYQMNTGNTMAGYPSVGSWISYGLGTMNQSLPSFVVLADHGMPNGGSLNWGSGYLPGIHQGTPFRASNLPVLNLEDPRGMTRVESESRRKLIEQLNRRYRERHPAEEELAARIELYELAARMQAHGRDLIDLSDEPAGQLKRYGIESGSSATFGRRMLLAARLVYKYVRFVQVYAGSGAAWDGHNNIAENHGKQARATDQAVAALLVDLEERGLLDETLVIFHTEFGRTPTSQNGNGRDHHTNGFSVWLAGAGIKGGTVYGETDELGEKVVSNPVQIADLHATVLHLLGLDPQRLTFDRSGREFALNDGKGRVLHEILA